MKKKEGFSLIELSIAVAILSFGILLIYESFFTIVDAATVMPSFVKTQFHIDEMIWQAEDALRRENYLPIGLETGYLNIDNKDYGWSKETYVLSTVRGLYKIKIIFSWKTGDRILNNSCIAYVRR